MNKYIVSFLFLCFYFLSNAQVNIVEGYVYEDGNRGFLNQVSVEIVDKESGVSVFTGETNQDGFFQAEVTAGKSYVVHAQKQLFYKKSVDFKTSAKDGDKQFVKVKMQREPGYDFEVTLAPKRESVDIPVDAIVGAWIEVYNNTTKEEVLNLKDHPEMDFDVHFDQGNHYTIMIRKDGFLTKRMEAYVNIEGCILCFDGVGNVQPGVTDNLSDKNTMGVLLANVELDPLFDGKTFTVENIFYDLGKATLRSEAKKSLKNLALVIKDNPQIKVELGAHTDSRGTAESNLDLSKRRAEAAVDYLVNTLDVSTNQIISAGFGEQYLKNKCADGVQCSEAEHQENRRTEIRVLNVDKTKKNLKTLAEIRVEEEFLKTIFDGESEVKTEEEMESSSSIGGQARSEEEIKQIEKEIAEQEARKKKEKEQRELQLQKERQEANENMQKKELQEKSRIEREALRVEQERIAMEQQKAAEEEMEAMEKQKLAEEEKKALELAIEKNQEETKAEKSNDLPVFEGRMVKVEKKKEIQEEVVEGEFMNPVSQRSKFEEVMKKKNPMFNYTGYKIVVHFSQDPISKDHEIFTRHNDLVEYKSKSGSVLYMIGDYKSKEDAEDFLLGRVVQVYPGAYIVGFKNGNRLN